MDTIETAWTLKCFVVTNLCLDDLISFSKALPKLFDKSTYAKRKSLLPSVPTTTLQATETLEFTYEHLKGKITRCCGPTKSYWKMDGMQIFAPRAGYYYYIYVEGQNEKVTRKFHEEVNAPSCINNLSSFTDVTGCYYKGRMVSITHLSYE